MRPIALQPEDQAELIALEEAMWREATRFDRSFQETRFAPDFFEFGRSGKVYMRSDVIREVSAPIRAKLPLDNVQVRALDLDTAQVTYDSAVTYGNVIEHAHRSSIWSRTSAGWIMRFHQGTPYDP